MTGQRGGIVFRLLLLVLVFTFGAVIYLARAPLLRTAATFWIVQDRIEPADVIIVIGDDNFTADRAAEAAALYHAGWAPLVVASGRMLRPYASMSDFMARDLEAQGVPHSDVFPFSHKANNTLEEAEALRSLISGRGWRRVLLVTSNYHTRRARYIFRRVLPPGVVLEVAAAPGSTFEPASWWQSRQGRKTFFLETFGYVLAVWELRERQEGSSSAHSAPVGLAQLLLTATAPEYCKNPAFSRLHRYNAVL